MGCRVCRARKVKCDGRPGGCRNCERLQLDCVADDGSKSTPLPSTPRKIRTYRSCQSCRSSKTKCNGARPRCARCSAKRTPCVYDGGAAPRWTQSLAPEDSASEDEAPSSAASLDDHPLAWLLAVDLPTGKNLRRVVEQYFSNVHPLRCFAFVHKPSFLRQLDGGWSDDESALVHVICAHGAKFLALSAGMDTPNAGIAWANRAEHLLLSNFGKISVQRLMAAILLHDFHFRLGEYGQALMISGLAVRMAHALKINAEYNADVLCAEEPQSGPSVASRESRRRLMWACYVLDAWAGSGVDQLTLLREGDIKIQLPCNERNFGLRIPCITETLGVGHVLQFLPPAIVPRRPAANMGIMAYYIRVVALWKRIVRYNHVHLHTAGLAVAAPGPWAPDSQFAALDADLALWRRELPDFVEYSTDTIYARLDSNQLGALLLIHCTYHHNYLELYKLTMPDLFKLARPFVFPVEQQGFLRSAQANCYHHARQIADILAEAAEHGGARVLSDCLLPFFVYDSSRVMLYYVARLLDPAREDADALLVDATTAVESNARVLRIMAALFPVAQSLAVTIERWLSKIKQTVSSEELVSSLRAADDKLQGLPSQKRIAKLDVPESNDWSRANPNAGGPETWDGTSAGNALTKAKQSLQHERPVPESPTPLCEALDLDDLQNFLSWDMYGIMEIGGSVSNADMDWDA